MNKLLMKLSTLLFALLLVASPLVAHAEASTTSVQHASDCCSTDIVDPGW